MILSTIIRAAGLLVTLAPAVEGVWTSHHNGDVAIELPIVGDALLDRGCHHLVEAPSYVTECDGHIFEIVNYPSASWIEDVSQQSQAMLDSPSSNECLWYT